MIKKRLIVSQPHANFHFSKWERNKFEKYFETVIYHTIKEDPEMSFIHPEDVLYVYGAYGSIFRYEHVNCKKFAILYPGFGFNPYTNSHQIKKANTGYKHTKEAIEKIRQANIGKKVSEPCKTKIIKG